MSARTLDVETLTRRMGLLHRGTPGMRWSLATIERAVRTETLTCDVLALLRRIHAGETIELGTVLGGDGDAVEAEYISQVRASAAAGCCGEGW